jgi:gamma-glutamylcyclotransferase (GGCT)/AIG2-like uncharacterized protein YtfP
VRVAGEVYAFSDVERALKILDAVEGFRANAPERSLFKRESVEVALVNKRGAVAWVYWLNRGFCPQRRIVSGDYAANRHD